MLNKRKKIEFKEEKKGNKYMYILIVKLRSKHKHTLIHRHTTHLYTVHRHSNTKQMRRKQKHC